MRVLPVLGLLVALNSPAQAQPVTSPMMSATGSDGPAVLSQPPLLPAFGGLSDGGPVLRPYIDKFAFNARADIVPLADTAQRRQAFVIPYGFSFAVLHLVEGGIFTNHAFWKEGERSVSSNGPLSLNLKVRLWPLFAKDPNQHFTVVAAYQHEVRTGPFDGPNQLGLLADAAALRVAASWPIWLFDLGVSAGAVYDYQGRFAAGELGARFGLRLDFISLDDTRVSIEGLIRGLPSYVRADAGLPDPQNAIPLSGALFFGVNTRMTKTSDFGVWLQKGFGGVAPLSFGVRVFGIFIGDGYLRPRPVWATIVSEFAEWVKEQIALIDPVLRDNCVIYDEPPKAGQTASPNKHAKPDLERSPDPTDGPPIGKFGRLAKDGQACVDEHGFRVPIHERFLHDKKYTRICREEDPDDCILRNDGFGWYPIHRPRLDGQCYLRDSDGRVIDKLGTPSTDGKTCHWVSTDQHGRHTVHDLEIGRRFHSKIDPKDARAWVCFNESGDNDARGCFFEYPKDHRFDSQDEAGSHLRDATQKLGQDLVKAKDTVQDVASGRIDVGTVADHAQKQADQALRECSVNQKECAKSVFNRTLEMGKDYLDRAENFYDESTQDKLNDTMDATPNAWLGAAVGGVGGVLEKGVQKAAVKAGAGKLEKAVVERVAKKGAEKVIEHKADAAAHQAEEGLAKATVKHAGKKGAEDGAQHTGEAAARRVAGAEGKRVAEAEADHAARANAVKAAALSAAQRDALLQSAKQPFKDTSLTQAGRALTKHPEVIGLTKDTLRQELPTTEALNTAAEKALGGMLQHGTVARATTGRFGQVIEVVGPNGSGARYSASGEFIGFLNP